MPALLDTLLDQPVARQMLDVAMRAERIHHAYLFSGPVGVGKELAAYGFAQALLCSARDAAQSAACGMCSACTRLLASAQTRTSTHPDLMLLGRGLYDHKLIGRKTPETQDLSVDQIRTLVLDKAAYAPHEGRARVYLMRNADELSTSAANALLKTLEEPIAKVHFLLLTSRPKALLPTIRSRVLPIRFGRLSDRALRTLAPEATPAAIAQARGQLCNIELAAASSAAQSDLLQKIVRAASDPTLTGTLDLSDNIKKLAGDAETELAAVLAEVAQLGRSGAQAQAEATPSAIAVSQALGRTPQAHEYAALYTEIMTLLRELDRNASPALATEKFAVRLRSAGLLARA
jgi:DNA polymerase III subunit delta'